jgi:hypothetical protein
METTTPETEAANSPESQTPEQQLDALTDAQIAALTRTLLDPLSQEEVEDAQQVQQAEETPEAEDPTEETPPDENAEDDADPDEPAPVKGRQIRLKGPDFQFATLRKSGVSPEEAARIAYGIEPSKPSPVTEDAPTQSQEPSEMEAVAARLEELEDEIVDATDLVDSDKAKLLKRERAKLNEKRTELMLDAKLKAIEAQRTQEQQAETKYQESVQSALSMYPSLSDPKSEFSKRAEAIRSSLEATNNPIIYQDNFALVLAQMTGNALLVPPSLPGEAKTTSAAKVAMPKPSGRTPAAPPQPLPTRGTPPVKTMTEADLDNLSPAELNILIRQTLGKG